MLSKPPSLDGQSRHGNNRSALSCLLMCRGQVRIWRKERRLPPAKGDKGVNSFLRNLKHKGGAIGVEQLGVSLLKSKASKGRFDIVLKGVRDQKFKDVRDQKFNRDERMRRLK